MSQDLEYSPGPADQAVANAYDSFAEAYAAETESNLINGYYTRPAVLDLAGDVAGRRILDVGCGAGPLLAALRERGAVVTGVDSSTKMLELARQRLGDGADLHPADLSSPLPSPTARSTMSSRAWYCTIWRTGRHRSPNCGACWRPAADSSWP